MNYYCCFITSAQFTGDHQDPQVVKGVRTYDIIISAVCDWPAASLSSRLSWVTNHARTPANHNLLLRHLGGRRWREKVFKVLSRSLRSVYCFPCFRLLIGSAMTPFSENARSARVRAARSESSSGLWFQRSALPVTSAPAQRRFKHLALWPLLSFHFLLSESCANYFVCGYNSVTETCAFALNFAFLRDWSFLFGSSIADWN